MVIQCTLRLYFSFFLVRENNRVGSNRWIEDWIEMYRIRPMRCGWGNAVSFPRRVNLKMHFCFVFLAF